MAGVGMLLEIKKKKDGTLGHFVGGVVADGAAAGSGRIAASDELLAVNGNDCSKLDAKQLHDLVIGPEGSCITLEFIKQRHEEEAQRSDGSKNNRFQVVLVRGGKKVGDGVSFTLTLDADLKSIGDKEAFKKDVIKDVAAAAKIDEKHVSVTGLRAGSVLVDMLIAKEAGDAQKIVQNLEEQLESPNSLLMQVCRRKLLVYEALRYLCMRP
jgi:C-terminal processing protease CtpA/Prc